MAPNSRQPTKDTYVSPGGSTIEYDSINSVELTNTIKDGWRVSTVKVYDVDPQAAVDRAIAAAEYAQQRVGRLNTAPKPTTAPS